MRSCLLHFGSLGTSVSVIYGRESVLSRSSYSHELVITPRYQVFRNSSVQPLECSTTAAFDLLTYAACFLPLRPRSGRTVEGEAIGPNTWSRRLEAEQMLGDMDGHRRYEAWSQMSQML